MKSLWKMTCILGFLWSSGCMVSGTTLPEKLIDGEPIIVTVMLDSLISYGTTADVAPTLCVNAPENWEIKAISFVGFTEREKISGVPSFREGVYISGLDSPENYKSWCWNGPRHRFDLASNGKVRLEILPKGLGTADLNFIAGYDDRWNYHALPVSVEVINREVEDEI